MRTFERWSGHCIMPGFSGFPVSSGRREENHRRSRPIRSHTGRHPFSDALCQQVRTSFWSTPSDICNRGWPFNYSGKLFNKSSASQRKPSLRTAWPLSLSSSLLPYSPGCWCWSSHSSLTLTDCGMIGKRGRCIFSYLYVSVNQNNWG